MMIGPIIPSDMCMRNQCRVGPSFRNRGMRLRTEYNNSATLRESLLEKVFDMAERWVEASKKHYSPGIIGPFCLQTCVDKDMNFSIYDVAPRIGGGTNVHMWSGHPYANSLWRKPVSTGRRIAMEIRRAASEDRLDEIIS